MTRFYFLFWIWAKNPNYEKQTVIRFLVSHSKMSNEIITSYFPEDKIKKMFYFRSIPFDQEKLKNPITTRFWFLKTHFWTENPMTERYTDPHTLAKTAVFSICPTEHKRIIRLPRLYASGFTCSHRLGTQVPADTSVAFTSKYAEATCFYEINA